MPIRVDPCMALPARVLPETEGWGYEVSWGGSRVALHLDHGDVRVLNPSGTNRSARFPAVVRSARELGPASIIIDGEIVFLDRRGRADYDSLSPSGCPPLSSDTVLLAFDILYLDGRDLRSLPLKVRRRLLETLLARAAGAIRLAVFADGDVGSLYSQVDGRGPEGVIAKKLESPYVSGQCDQWVKIRFSKTGVFVITGYEPSGDGKSVKSLMVAARNGDDVVPVGIVENGIGDKTAVALRSRLEPIRIEASAVGRGSRNFVYVDPVVAASLEYQGWTAETMLRNASFKRLLAGDVADSVHKLSPADE